LFDDSHHHGHDDHASSLLPDSNHLHGHSSVHPDGSQKSGENGEDICDKLDEEQMDRIDVHHKLARRVSMIGKHPQPEGIN